MITLFPNKRCIFIGFLILVTVTHTLGANIPRPLEVAISILSGTTANTTVSADFKCRPRSGPAISEISGRFNLSQTFIPCTGLKSLVQSYVFDVTTTDGKRHPLVIKDLRTVSLYLNGEQIATQSGPIDGPLCRSSKVVLTHWFTTLEPMSCSSPNGLTHVESPMSTLRISGGDCEAFCTGLFVLDYSPGLKNSRLPGLDVYLKDDTVRSLNRPLTAGLKKFISNALRIGLKF